MKRWRCNQCGAMFRAEKPKCAACGIDPAEDPRFAAVFHELVTIHFDPPSAVKHMGKGKAACNGVRVGLDGVRATGDATVVNCEACRETDAWKAAYRGPAKLADGHDEPYEPAGVSTANAE